MTISTANISYLLQNNLNKIAADTNQWPDQIGRIFKFSRATKRTEYDVEMKGLPIAFNIGEGEPAPSADIQQMFRTTYEMQKIGMSCVFTQEAIDDNQYKEQLQIIPYMKNSILENEMTTAGGIFNNGWDPEYPLGDGKSLFNTHHPIINGTVANTWPTPVDFNERGVEDGLLMGQYFRAASGNKYNGKVKALHISPKNQWAAQRLYGSSGRTGTGDNDINVLKGIFPKGIIIDHYIDIDDYWAILYEHDNSFRYFLRQELKMQSIPDSSTGNIICTFSKRLAMGCSNFRGIVGSGGYVI